MKKGLIFNVLFFTLILAPVANALADSQNPLTPILTRLVGVVYTVFGLFATICFIYAGLMFAIAKGDAQKLEQAKSGLIWAVVGVGLGLISASIMPILNTWLNPAS